MENSSSLPPPEFRCSQIAHNIYKSLGRFVEVQCLGELYIEAGYKVTADKRNWVQPDVSFISETPLDDTGRFLFGAPDLAIEVISPSERPKHILAKRDAGCREIWMVRPKSRKIEVWSPHGTQRTLTVSDVLTSPLFEGWSMSVAGVFAETN